MKSYTATFKSGRKLIVSAEDRQEAKEKARREVVDPVFGFELSDKVVSVRATVDSDYYGFQD